MISTYAELKTALANWLKRTDLTTDIPNFITFGEAYLRREVKSPKMFNTVTVSTSMLSRFATLPAGCSEIVSLVDEYGNPLSLRPASEVLAASVGASVGVPSSYTVTSQIEFNKVPDQVYSLSRTYRKKLDIATESTNWLLTEYPDAYLYASLLQAMPFIRNDARAPMIESMLGGIVASINSVSKNRPKLVTDYPGTVHLFNINRGY